MEEEAKKFDRARYERISLVSDGIKHEVYQREILTELTLLRFEMKALRKALSSDRENE